MTVYYFEGSPIVAPLTIESKRVVLASESASGRRFTRSSSSQRWDLSFGVVTSTPEEVFLGSLDNDTVVGTMTMPQLTTIDKLYHGSSASYPTVNTLAASGTTTLSSVSGTVIAGSFIQFSGHSKIYVARSSLVDTTGSITIFPALQKSIQAGTQIRTCSTWAKPQLTYKRSLDSISGVTFTDGVLTDAGTITIHEVI